MKPSPLLLAITVLLAVLGTSPAQAEDIALSFDLPVIAPPAPPPPPTDSAGAIAPETSRPLPIPPRATNPPMRYHSPQQLPSGVYRQGVAVALNEESTPASILPPAPPQLMPVAGVGIAAPEPQSFSTTGRRSPPQSPRPEDIALSFDVAPMPLVVVAQTPPASPSPADLLLSLFEGDSNSIVARAVGSAEGTRTPEGGLTAAYYGHTDPGNQVWNMGTFSYQHGAATPTEADKKQLIRLQSQSQVLKRRALKQGMTLTLEETLNGIDLANQSPLAATGRVGYVERLAEAKKMGYEGTEAIVVARTRSYINPDTQRWNAPGLGNTEASITRDQRRRANAVARTLVAYQQERPDLVPSTWTLGPAQEPTTLPERTAMADAPDSQEPVDIIFQLWTDGAESTHPSTLTSEHQSPAKDPTISQDSNPADEFSAPGLAAEPGATPDTLLHFPSAFSVREANFANNTDSELENSSEARPGGENLETAEPVSLTPHEQSGSMTPSDDSFNLSGGENPAVDRSSSQVHAEPAPTVQESAQSPETPLQ